jgi:hypothetical protein
MGCRGCVEGGRQGEGGGRERADVHQSPQALVISVRRHGEVGRIHWAMPTRIQSQILPTL